MSSAPVVSVTDELLAEIEQEAYDGGFTGSSYTLALTTELRRLRAENEGLRVDAGRYRFLRDDAQWIEDVPTCITWKTNGDPQEILSEEELDAAIDTAMQSNTEGIDMGHSIDYRTGYRYASEILHDQSTNQVEALVTGMQKWKEPTARNLIAAAQARIDAGINLEYQKGVIDRASAELSA